MLFAILFNLLTVVTCICAVWWGQWEERATIAIAIVASLLTVFMTGSPDVRFHAASLSLMLIDAGTLLCLGAVALGSRKFWPLWVSAAQLVTVLANVAPLIEQHGSPRSYAFAERMWSWLILAMVLVSSLRSSTKRSSAKES